MIEKVSDTITSIPQILEHVERDSLLLQIYQLEPQRLDHVVDTAFKCEWPDERWQEYERCKEMAARFVGIEAKHPELRTSAHYEVVLAFIDWLLPEGMEDAS